MATYLTMKEAATLTGKSPSSIRRIIYPILHDDKHPDRKQIRPTVEEVKQLRSKGENFPWRVSEELLRREVPAGDSSNKPHSATHGSTVATGADALVDMLRRELDIKNGQITQQSELISKQMELISGLSERLREGNVLIGSLQQRFALPDGANRVKEFVDATPSAGESSEKKKSRSWLGRLFRTA
jgi:hypothetical protein